MVLCEECGEAELVSIEAGFICKVGLEAPESQCGALVTKEDYHRLKEEEGNESDGAPDTSLDTPNKRRRVDDSGKAPSPATDTVDSDADVDADNADADDDDDDDDFEEQPRRTSAGSGGGSRRSSAGSTASRRNSGAVVSAPASASGGRSRRSSAVAGAARRRSSAAATRAAAGSDGEEDDDGDDDFFYPDNDEESYDRARNNKFSDEYLRRQRNIAMLKKGMIKVERETVLPHLLHLSPAERKCYEPFIPHAHLRSAESVQLAKKKTLGMRGPRNFTPGNAFVRVRAGIAGPDADAHVPCEPLVLWHPGDDENAPEGAAPIELENFLCHWLRPHQRIGVQFLFDCVTGQKEFGGEGCILADDMGLGKTLMSIALIWLVLKHGFAGKDGEKICKRIVVCCPTSLVFNWNNEILKWLKGKIKCIAVGNTGSSVARDIGDFCAPRCPAPVLILSYETFRTYKKVFYAEGKCDLLICDEAHRLKNDQTQTSQVLAALPTLKRVLLSGTPLQNRLDEFYAMVNFCNPGVFGTVSEFRKNYERPILAGMEPDCTDDETEKAKTTSARLSTISNQFILRRTNTLLAKHLPTKLLTVVCCKPTPLQVQLYNHFLKSKSVKQAMRESGEEGNKMGGAVLGIIQSLSKLCNHPRLVYPTSEARGGGRRGKAAESAGFADTFSDCTHLFPDNFDIRGDSQCGYGGGRKKSSRGSVQQPTGDGGIMSELSGKMSVLDRLLCEMRQRGTERIVIVSNFTQTLDQIGLLCKERFFPCVRLDGSMAVKKRRVLVEDFNDPAKDQFAFLLSSKAGGCGLNLIGANRLILFDPDWNPATDKQAAARVWRDGQKRRCYVYRFLTAGTIEEKVFQRQLSKEGLQSIVVDDKMTVNAQSTDELRDIFTLGECASSTHDSLKCTRCNGIWGCGEKKGGGAEEDLQTWAHHNRLDKLKDKAFQAAAGSDVSFVFALKFQGQRFDGWKCEDDTDDEDAAGATAAAGGEGSAAGSAAAAAAAAAAAEQEEDEADDDEDGDDDDDE